jgi:hypothetical protein
VFDFYRVLNNPPLGWYEGVGFVVDSTIKKHMFYPPSDDMVCSVAGSYAVLFVSCSTRYPKTWCVYHDSAIQLALHPANLVGWRSGLG